MVLVYSIGKSVEGRDLWVTRISKQVKYSHGSRQKRQLLKPMVKIVANIHGNEVSRGELISESIFILFLSSKEMYESNHCSSIFQCKYSENV